MENGGLAMDNGQRENEQETNDISSQWLGGGDKRSVWGIYIPYSLFNGESFGATQSFPTI